MHMSQGAAFSVPAMFLGFKWRIGFTMSLVLLESVLAILYPLCIGLAINSLLEDNMRGLALLAGLGVASTLIGSARRYYDTRLYSRIYRTITPEMVERGWQQKNSTSSISARANLLTEFVEFMENSLPEIVTATVSLVGALVIISVLNTEVFLACLGVLLVLFAVYGFSGRLNYRLNAGYNSELERQVISLDKQDPALMRRHFNRLMTWNIRLSDLETVNYLLVWLAIVALFVFTPMSAVNSGVTNYGLIFSLLMYVFGYIESIANFPLFIQQLIRLREITVRLASTRQASSKL